MTMFSTNLAVPLLLSDRKDFLFWSVPPEDDNEEDNDNSPTEANGQQPQALAYWATGYCSDNRHSAWQHPSCKQHTNNNKAVNTNKNKTVDTNSFTCYLQSTDIWSSGLCYRQHSRPLQRWPAAHRKRSFSDASFCHIKVKIQRNKSLTIGPIKTRIYPNSFKAIDMRVMCVEEQTMIS